MATPLSHLRVVLGRRPRNASSFPPRGPHARLGGSTSFSSVAGAAAPPYAVRFLPRHAPPAGGRGCVTMPAAAATLAGATTRRRCSTNSRSRGPPIQRQLPVAGVGLPPHPRGHSTAPRASAADATPPLRPDSPIVSGGWGEHRGPPTPTPAPPTANRSPHASQGASGGATEAGFDTDYYFS